VFTSGVDPVRAGLVSSFSQPEGNVTGVSWFSGELGAKHLELVRELVPKATLIAVFANPRNREAALYEQPLREAATRVPGAGAAGARAVITAFMFAEFKPVASANGVANSEYRDCLKMVEP